MTEHSDDDQRKWEERQRGLEQVREMLGQALIAHEMSDEESYEAMINIDLDNVAEDVQQRLDNLPDEDPIGYGAFGDNPEWIDRQLGDG
jgi:hypothetical protein